MQWKRVKVYEHVKDAYVIVNGVNGVGDNIFGYFMFVINMKSNMAFTLRHRDLQIHAMIYPHLQQIHHKYEICFGIFLHLDFSQFKINKPSCIKKIFNFIN